jgi:hypothetical protein
VTHGLVHSLRNQNLLIQNFSSRTEDDNSA